MIFIPVNPTIINPWFTDLVTTHDLHQYVDCATRNAGHTLDHVISRASDGINRKVFVISSEISDHTSATFSIKHTTDKQYTLTNLKPRRDLRHFDCKTLTSEINPSYLASIYHPQIQIPFLRYIIVLLLRYIFH